MLAYDIVVLDMDGTLVDTDLMLVEAMMVLFRKHRPGFKISLTDLLYFSGPPIEDTLKTYFPDMDQAQIIQEFKDESFRFYESDTLLFPHAKEAIKELRAMGVKIAILTNKHRDRTIATLRMLGIEALIDFIVGYDDVKRPKPDPEGMRVIMNHFSSAPERILFVGDTIYDYEVAIRSGVHSALAAWSLRRFPPEVTPTVWLTGFDKLTEVVRHGTTHL